MRVQFLAILLLISGNSLWAATKTSLPAVSKKQVYELFTQKTGLQLNDLAAAIKGDEASRKKLQKFSLAQNSDSALFAISEQTKRNERDCLAQSASGALCNKPIDMGKDRESQKKQSQKVLAGDLNSKTLQWHLAVLSHAVDEQVIGKFMGEWIVQCDKSGKMSSADCKTSLENVGQFQELMSKLLLWNANIDGAPEALKVSESTIRDTMAAYGK